MSESAHSFSYVCLANLIWSSPGFPYCEAIVRPSVVQYPSGANLNAARPCLRHIVLIRAQISVVIGFLASFPTGLPSCLVVKIGLDESVKTMFDPATIELELEL